MMEKTTRQYKLRLTAIIGFTQFAYYLNFGCLPQTLLDLQDLLAVNEEDLAKLFAIRGFAYFAGTVLFGWLYGVVNRQYAYGIAAFLLGICMVFTPRILNLWATMLLTSIIGIANGGLDIACNVLILEMWGKQCNSYLQAAHLCASIGSLISPLLCSLFVSTNISKELKNVFTSFVNDTQIEPINQGSQIGTLHLITGSAALLASVAIFVNEIIEPYTSVINIDTSTNIDVKGVKSNEKHEVKVIESYEQQVEMSKTYKTIFIMLASLLYCFHYGVDVNASNFFPIFLTRLNLGINNRKSSLMTSALTASSAVLKVIGFFFANKVSTSLILGTSFVVILSTNVIITLIAVNSELMMWISLVIFGFGTSLVNPSLFTYFGKRIAITNAIASLFLFFTSVIPASSAFFISTLIDKNPLLFMYFNTLLSVVTLLFFTSILLIQYQKSIQCNYEPNCERYFISNF